MRKETKKRVGQIASMVLIGVGGGLFWQFLQSYAEGTGILFLVLVGIISLVAIASGVGLNFSTTTNQQHSQIAESTQRQTKQTK